MYLLQDSVDSLSSPDAYLGSLQMPEHDEAAPDGLIDSLQLHFRCDHTVDDHVNERSQRRRDANAVDGFDIRLAEVGTMQTKHSRNCGHPLEACRDSHVQLRRHRVGQFVQRQRGRVAEHTLRAILTVAGPKLPDNQVRPRRKRILRQTVEALPALQREARHPLGCGSADATSPNSIMTPPCSQ